ncbi:MAG: hypothetical protein MHMPM18_001893 [Marteilia pararefringens]
MVSIQSTRKNQKKNKKTEDPESCFDTLIATGNSRDITLTIDSNESTRLDGIKSCCENSRIIFINSTIYLTIFTLGFNMFASYKIYSVESSEYTTLSDLSHILEVNSILWMIGICFNFMVIVLNFIM